MTDPQERPTFSLDGLPQEVRSSSLWLSLLVLSGPLSIPLFIFLILFASKGVDGGWGAMALVFVAIPVIAITHLLGLPILIFIFIKTIKQGNLVPNFMRFAFAYHAVALLLILFYWRDILSLAMELFHIHI